VPKRAFLPVVAFAVLAAMAEAFVARRFLLDDALIHVRAAGLLLQAGFPTADGVTRSFADSSPLFLGFTALGLWSGGSFWAAKILSLAAFGALVAALAVSAWREPHPLARATRLALLLFVLSPFGVKWLTDGMETSLAVLLALTLAATLQDDRGRSLRAGAVAGLCVLVRPELAVLVAASGVGQLVRGSRRLAAAVASGGLVALAAIHAVFGGMWSDAAIAKLRHAYSLGEFLELLASVAAGAGLLGAGLALAWLALLAIALRVAPWRDPDARALLLGMLSLPLVLVAIAVRGQAIEGIRPLLPFLAFAVACGTALVGRWVAARPMPARALVPLAVLFAAAWLADALAFDRIVGVQARSMEAMRTRDWSGLRGHAGVAWDVGYLAYFSQSPVCDAQGLINGPALARLTLPERLQRCAAVAEFAFVDQPRYRILTTALDMRGWRLCDRFDFAHRAGPVNVYLLVAPQLAREPLCSEAALRIEGTLDFSLRAAQR
jgi:hypothetical protein